LSTYDKKLKLIINRALNWISANLSKEAKSLVFDTDEEGNIKGQFVVPVYANTNEAPVTPTTFKQAQATAAGATTLWSPAAGKKFRLMGGIIVLSKEAACAGAEYISIIESTGAVTIARFDISIAALVAIGSCTIIPLNLPANGYLALTKDSVLQIYLGGVLTAGNCSVSVWGTEE
jgi:hypothetical protein